MSKAAKLSLAAVVLILVGGTLYIWLNTSPIKRAASRMLDGLRDGDGKVLYDAAIEDECGCSNLTPEKLHQAWEILIAPHIADSKYVGADPVSWSPQSPTQAVATYHYRTSAGVPWDLDMIANEAGSNYKINVVYMMLSSASYVEGTTIAQPNATAQMILDGLHRYRPKLEAIGIHKVMLAPGTCYTWDELEARLERGMHQKSAPLGKAR